MTNLKFKQISSLPTNSDSGTIYYLSDGSQFIGKSDGTFLKVTDIEFVTTLPSSPKDKLYVLIENDSLKLYAYKDGKYIELSSTVKSHTHLISEVANLQTILDELRTDVNKKAEIPISATSVSETADKVFVSPSQRSQITANTSSININTQRIQNLEDSLGVVTTTDEKVKMNANDTSGYLEDKIDNSTIQQQNNKLTVPFLNNIVATSEEINHLQGVTSNIQQQINSISGVSAFRGVFASLTDLQALTDSQEGEYAIVSDGTESSYYFFYGNQWDFSHNTQSVINIDLANTTGVLPKDRYEKQNAQETPVLNTQGNFVGSNVEDVLNELFTLSNSSKNSIVSAIGFPVVNNDTFTQIKDKIEQLKIIFANYLVAHQIPAYPYEPVGSLIEKVKSIEAVETTGSTKIKENINVTSVPHVENIALNALIPMKQFGMSVIEFTEGNKNVEHYNAKFSEYIHGNDIEVNNGIKTKHDYEEYLNQVELTSEYVAHELVVDSNNLVEFKFNGGV